MPYQVAFYLDAAAEFAQLLSLSLCLSTVVFKFLLFFNEESTSYIFKYENVFWELFAFEIVT